MVGRSVYRPGSGWEPLQHVLERSGFPPAVQKWSGDPPGIPEVLGRPSSRSGIGRETLPEVQ